MKLLIWPSKLLKFVKLIPIKPKSPFVIFVFTVIVGVSCRIHNQTAKDQSPNPDQPSSNSSSWSLNPMDYFKSRPEYSPLYSVTPEGKAIRIGKISHQACEQFDPIESPNLRIKFDIKSAFGTQQAVVDVGTGEQSQGAAVEVGGQKILLNPKNFISHKEAEKLCSEVKSKSETDMVIASVAAFKASQEWLNLIAPDCNTSIVNEEMFCNIEDIDPGEALVELKSLRKTMIRRWSRQPYVLSRRVSLSITLAEALAKKNPEKAMGRICKIVKYSDSMEVPLVMASKLWQDVVCEKLAGDPHMAARVGLHKALAEIEFLRSLFERTSKLGVLTIRIPRSDAPSKDLWVYLYPEKDVREFLASEAKILGALTDSSINGEFKSSKSCWHPIFGSDIGSLDIARHLDLTGEASGISCIREEQSDEFQKLPFNYLADSITSESEFIVTNGRSKLLRLPAGTYKYEIKGHSKTIKIEPLPQKSTSGKIEWSNRRPRATIKSW